MPFQLPAADGRLADGLRPATAPHCVDSAPAEQSHGKQELLLLFDTEP